MDIHMPVMDGVAAFRAIRNEFPQVPVVAFTADTRDEQKAYYLREVGFDAYLTKPASNEDLKALITRFVS